MADLDAELRALKRMVAQLRTVVGILLILAAVVFLDSLLRKPKTLTTQGIYVVDDAGHMQGSLTAQGLLLVRDGNRAVAAFGVNPEGQPHLILSFPDNDGASGSHTAMQVGPGVNGELRATLTDEQGRPVAWNGG